RVFHVTGVQTCALPICNRTISVDFLGAPALLPQGPWLLAGLLRTPVNVLFCLREGHGYRIMLRRLIDDLTWTRLTREQVIRDARSEELRVGKERVVPSG